MKLLYVLFVIFLVIFSAITIANVEDINLIEESKEIVNDIKYFLSELSEEDQEEILNELEEAKETFNPIEAIMSKAEQFEEGSVDTE